MLNFKSNYDTIQKENKQFESYYNQAVTGLDVATIINKAMDINNKNENQKESKGNFIDNETNSINVDIKMLDNDKTYNMIRIFNGGISTFTQYYGNIKFKCTNIESTQIPHSSLNSYYEQSLYSSKKKAGSYIDGRCTSLLAYIRSPACDGSVPAALTNQSIPRF